ncbi:MULTISPECIES: choice-of-anchor C family protein [unclassified Streptomyces]|uniref:choice-of-anchor C family protein n=1 Tax=unclassified Streptomyces TaxID=2593676 RepID=UPI003809D3E8
MLSIRACVIAAASSALFVSSVATASMAQAASRFDDGSFEYPRAAANSFSTLTAGQSIGPWQVTAGTVDLIGAGFWQAAEGDQSVDLNGGNAGAVDQTFTTVPGATYTVSYALAGNPGGAPAVKTGRALIDGQNFQDFSFDITGKTFANMRYVNRQFTFRATNSTTTIGFASTTANSAYGPVLDDVQIERCAPCPTC